MAIAYHIAFARPIILIATGPSVSGVASRARVCRFQTKFRVPDGLSGSARKNPVAW